MRKGAKERCGMGGGEYLDSFLDVSWNLDQTTSDLGFLVCQNDVWRRKRQDVGGCMWLLTYVNTEKPEAE